MRWSSVRSWSRVRLTLPVGSTSSMTRQTRRHRARSCRAALALAESREAGSTTTRAVSEEYSMKGHQFNHREKGFSLIEVLIAVVILSLGLLALASLQSSLIRAAADAKAQSLAMAVAKQKIEQLAAVQALGGADNGCVSPSAWVTGQVSCYRAITDEPATAVDGDPIATGVQAMGGIAFTVATTVTRYVYNISTLAYAVANDTALDAALVTSSPETLLPGKKFSPMVAAVAGTEAGGGAGAGRVEEALNGIAHATATTMRLNSLPGS